MSVRECLGNLENVIQENFIESVFLSIEGDERVGMKVFRRRFFQEEESISFDIYLEGLRNLEGLRRSEEGK